MSHAYRAVQWNRQKRLYDSVALLGVALYLISFAGVASLARPEATIETLLIRGFGTAALLLLHVVLSIGPLCRLDSRFLPLLYNRRHLGVLTFLAAAGHAGLALVQFHAFGDVNPLVSLLASHGRLEGLAGFPFQPLGLAALAILFLMAATSHDFWLANLTAPVWKSLHMLVYVAYGLLILHVVLGVLQAETNPVLSGMLGCGFVWVVGLHVVAGFRERGLDRPPAAEEQDGFVRACAVDEIREKRARIVCLAGERVAVFRHDGKISAVSNVCQHQNGPLGEGRIVDGCITCPWHGYQYAPETGASPPPFTEAVPTFRVRLCDGQVWIDPRPNAPGTRVEPARIEEDSRVARSDDEFYVGYLGASPPRIAAHTRVTVGLVLAVGMAAGLLAALGQGRFDPGTFEYGVAREFEGVLLERPYPMLLVPAAEGATAAFASHYLVVFGKHGAQDLVAGMDGAAVRVVGSRIHNAGGHMIEVRRIEPLDPARAADLKALERAGEQPLGTMTLVGEIVDSKCHLGVMKPGRGKPHQACAIRCISGGIPPVLRVEDRAGRVLYFLLVAPDGRSVNREVLQLVAEPVEIEGQVARAGDLLLLYADPATYRRVD